MTVLLCYILGSGKRRIAYNAFTVKPYIESIPVIKREITAKFYHGLRFSLIFPMHYVIEGDSLVELCRCVSEITIESG